MIADANLTLTVSDTSPRVSEMAIVLSLADKAEEIETLKSVEVKTITDPISFRSAGDILGRIKTVIKDLDEKRVELKAAALEEGKCIDATFKKLTGPLAELQKKFEAGMNDFALEEKRRKDAAIKAAREAEQRKLEEDKQRALALAAELEAQSKQAAETGDVKAETQHSAMSSIMFSQAEAAEEEQARIAAKPVNGKLITLGGDGMMTTASEWAFEITTPELVIRKYCTPDETLIRKAVKAGVREIPGVRIYEKAKFTNR